MTEMKKYKLIAMDLDGTLTQHKSKLEEKNKKLLEKLQESYSLVMVGAGGCERIYNQMNGFPIDIIGNYGIQQSTVVDGKFEIIRNDSYSIDKEFFERSVSNLRQQTGYTKYAGDNVEYHQSGMVTFPLLGTKANLQDKLAFDPSGAKRSAIYELVSHTFKDFNCFIGGTSSFDIPAKQYNKYTALLNYITPLKIDINDVLFLGDDFKKGGNDEHIMLNGVDYIKIEDYNKVSKILLDKGIIEEMI